MRIFITGGTGNIGQYVTKALLEAGHSLVLLTRTPSRIPAIAALEGVTAVEGNILDLETMDKALRGCDAVVHIALGWGNDPVEMLEHDTKVTLFLANAAEKAGVGKFVYTSSTAAMGNLRDGMDETALLVPSDLYGATKAASELYLLGFKQYYGGQGKYGKTVSLKRNIIRPGYTFSNPAYPGGASQSDTRFLDISKAVLQNEDLSLSENDGTQFLSAAQIAQLYVKLVESELNDEIFLALGRKFVSWADIARIAAEMTPSYTATISPPPDEIKRTPKYYNVDKMANIFGLCFNGDEDLREHIRWNLERAAALLAGKDVHNPYHVW
ncbi:MAG: NAD(P)-dependent oxidoreductase [Clostridiales bacterium]|jgi:UDP-glucose 4-epimerase|nr:NAD(P)-dependent oxidoreductase [Clostridiales bacterium]